MNSFIFSVTAIAILSGLAHTPALAQQGPVVPVPQSHVVNPNMSLSAPTSSPLQSQMRENYATQLRSTQRQLLRQDPSGLTRDELAVGHALNGYGAPR